jgi:hypothetical protein
MAYTFSQAYDAIEEISPLAAQVESLLTISNTDDAAELLLQSSAVRSFAADAGIPLDEDNQKALGDIAAFMVSTHNALRREDMRLALNPLTGAYNRAMTDPRAFAEVVAETIYQHGVVISLIPEGLGAYTIELRRRIDRGELRSITTSAGVAALALPVIAQIPLIATASVAGMSVPAVGAIVLAATVAGVYAYAVLHNRDCRRDAERDGQRLADEVRSACRRWLGGAEQLRETMVTRILTTIPHIAGTYDAYDGCRRFEAGSYLTRSRPAQGWIEEGGPSVKRGVERSCEERCDEASYMAVHLAAAREMIRRIDDLPDRVTRKRALVGILGFFRGYQGSPTRGCEALFEDTTPTDDEIAELLAIAGASGVQVEFNREYRTNYGQGSGSGLILAAAAAVGGFLLLK